MSNLCTYNIWKNIAEYEQHIVQTTIENDDMDKMWTQNGVFAKVNLCGADRFLPV
jgi:hypothetical protein